jgi:rfaE bifunctional protein kinase chain/domain
MREKSKKELLINKIEKFPQQKILIIGDLIADEFVYGKISRVSREAPVLILRFLGNEILPGGGANSANNIASLGAYAIPLGVVGQDEVGRKLLQSMKQSNIDISHIIQNEHYITPIKTRYLAGGIHSAKQQVLRIDRYKNVPQNKKLRALIFEKAKKLISEVDGILISDYGLGLVEPSFYQTIREQVNKQNIILTVDSRYNLMQFSGATAITPNEPEVEQALNIKLNDRKDLLTQAGTTLMERLNTEAVVITRGSNGMVLFEKGKEPEFISIYGSDEISDVTGAGDTVISIFTLALTAKTSFYEAARLANYAGGLVVMKRGTATITPNELIQAVKKDYK